MPSLPYHLVRWPIRFPGYPRPFWLINRDLIKEFIEKYKLEEIDQGYFSALKQPMTMENALPEKGTILPDFGQYGGIKGPHFHYGNKVFHISVEQWQEFTKPIVADFEQAIIASKKVTLGVETIIDMHDAFEGLPLDVPGGKFRR